MCISGLVCVHTYSLQTPGSRLVGMEACLMAGGKSGAPVPPPRTWGGSDNTQTSQQSTHVHISNLCFELHIGSHTSYVNRTMFPTSDFPFFFLIWDRAPLCVSGWPETPWVDQMASNPQRSACRRLAGAEIKGVFHHARLAVTFLKDHIGFSSPDVCFICCFRRPLGCNLRWPQGGAPTTSFRFNGRKFIL